MRFAFGCVPILLLSGLTGCTAVVDGEGVECGSDFDCGQGFVCVASAGKTTCMSEEDCLTSCDCQTDGDCQVSERCESHQCVPRSCTSDDDCGLYACDDDTCRSSCTSDADCNTALAHCQDPECVQ